MLTCPLYHIPCFVGPPALGHELGIRCRPFRMKGLEGMPRWGGIHNQSYLQFQIRYRNRFGARTALSTFDVYRAQKTRETRNKTLDVLELAHDEDLDVLALTETWLQTGEKALCAEIKDLGFNIQHTPRKSRGGGVGVITTRRLRIEKVKQQLTTKSFEYQEVLLKVPTSMRLLVIYRPGNTTTFSEFLCEFESLLHVITERREPTIICGDFNIHLEKVEDPCTKKFQNLLYDFGWSNIVSEKTHVAGGTLDLVLVQRSITAAIMSTDASQMGVSLEPDWLRSKPVFSRNRYGQEELLNLWTTLPSCPQSILDIPELGSDEPLKPAYLAQYTEEQIAWNLISIERPGGNTALGGNT
eukprot:sb/3466100/